MQPSRRNIVLCRDCEQWLPWLPVHACKHCGLPFTLDLTRCGYCLKHPPLYQRLQALFDYRWPVDAFMTQFKYQGQHYFAKMFGQLMVEYLSLTAAYDCIIPIPLHPLRQHERGFNQTLELAKTIARYTDIPLDRWSCTRVRHTTPQSLLRAKTRMANMQSSAFAVAPTFSAKQVLVIEDVVTTGATVNAFSKALLQAGVKTVDIWACCRTVL